MLVRRTWTILKAGAIFVALIAVSLLLLESSGAGASTAPIIDTADYHTCAVMPDTGVQCWGGNQHGELGDGTTDNSNVPVDVVEGSGRLSGISAVTTGYEHTCAVTVAGGAKCWGDNEFGQLGDDSTDNSLTPVDVLDGPGGSPLANVKAIVASPGVAQGYHTCALVEDDPQTAGYGVKCWGENIKGQLGDGTTTTRTTPVDVNLLASGVDALAIGVQHTCALLSTGGMKCWGNNGSGELGDNGVCVTPCSTPVNVVGLSSGVTKITAGGYAGAGRSCAVQNGGAKCWGKNDTSQLGDGTTTDRSTPVTVSGLGSGVADINTGGGHTCAITTGATAKCWGFNGLIFGWGVLGDDGACGDICSTPVDVCATDAPLPRPCTTAAGNALTDVVAIRAGLYHTCAQIAPHNTLKCWGLGGSGQLGIGPAGAQMMPFDVLIDRDRDSCLDTAELGSDPTQGGQRDPENFWDFFDTHTENGLAAGSTLAGEIRYTPASGDPEFDDIEAVLAHFGQAGDTNIDPLSDASGAGYHTRFDRGIGGKAPPDGTITIADIGAVVQQLDHTCS